MGGGIPKKNLINKISFWTRAKGGRGPGQFVKKFKKAKNIVKRFMLSVFWGFDFYKRDLSWYGGY